MKIRFLKNHDLNLKGTVTDTTFEAANYLIRVGAAEEVRYTEKEEKAPVKEKKENKTGNVPTAKKKK